MSENYIVINGKRAELTEEQLNQLGIGLPKNKRWRAERGEKYYRVNTFNEISSLRECCCDNDDWCYYSHNYFKTKEEAEKYARVLETEMLLRKYADEHNDELTWCSPNNFVWSICYSHLHHNDISFECWGTSQLARTVYFSSKDIAQSATKEIGKERIKEYLTYEW